MKIPEEAYECRLGSRSANEWIIGLGTGAAAPFRQPVLMQAKPVLFRVPIGQRLGPSDHAGKGAREGQWVTLASAVLRAQDRDVTRRNTGGVAA